MAELLAMGDAETVASWESLMLGYTETRGAPALRAAVAQRFVGVQPEQVLCCVPCEGILLLHALIRPGERVVVTAPGYQSLHTLAETLGCQVSFWQPRRLAGGWKFDVDDLAALVGDDNSPVGAIVINFPHNPTGCCLQPEELQRVVDLSRQHNAILFSDEVYCPLGIPSPSACELGYPRAITLGALSKTHSLPGLRVGWVVTHDQGLLEQMANAKDYTTICGSAPSEVLGIMALRATDTILARNRDIIQRNTEAASQFFGRWPHVFQWEPPAGGTTAFPQIITGEPASEFCARVLAGCQVLLLPSSEYDNCPPGEYFRLGLGRRNCMEVLRILEDYLTRTQATK